MNSAIVIILHAFVAQAITKEEDSLDKVADMMFDKLADKLGLQNTDLDGTTLGKPHADMGTPTMMRGAAPMVPPTVRMAQDKLRACGIAPSPLETLALTAIDANNRGIGMRNVAAMAMNMPSQTREALSQLGKEVVVKAAAISNKDDMAGITAPMNFFDPMGFSTDCSGEQLAFLREAELKHGRIGMIASLGFIAGEKLSPILGAPSELQGPMVNLVGKPLVLVPEQFWGAICVATMFTELIMLNAQAQNPALTEAGDFGFDPLGLKPKDAKGLMEMQNKELNNGRLAMLAAAGIVAQEQVTGLKIF